MAASSHRKIVVEAIIPAPVELVWERTQEPAQHTRWDIRFDTIRYLDEKDARGYSIMDYQTSIAFGMAVKGLGHYRHSVPLRHSSFEFDSDDWKSIIRAGKGLWLYEPRPEGTYFKTVYDYEIRHGLAGRIADRVLFRPLLRLATEWGFESLRLWCAGDEASLVKRRSRLRFLAFFLGRALGTKPAPGSARSWLGTGGAGDAGADGAGNELE